MGFVDLFFFCWWKVKVGDGDGDGDDDNGDDDRWRLWLFERELYWWSQSPSIHKQLSGD